MTDEQCEIVQKHFPVGKRAGRSRVRSAQDTLLGSFSKVFGQHMSLCVGHTAWVNEGILLFTWGLRTGSYDRKRLSRSTRNWCASGKGAQGLDVGVCRAIKAVASTAPDLLQQFSADAGCVPPL